MSLKRLKKIIKEAASEAVIPMDIVKNRYDLSLRNLLYNIASHKNPEEGFKKLDDLRTQLMVAVANNYISKNMQGKYFLTKKGEQKLRDMFSGR